MKISTEKNKLGEEFTVTEISMKEGMDLLDKHEGKLLFAKKHECHHDVYLLNDNRVLELHGPYAAFYPYYDSFESQYRTNERSWTKLISLDLPIQGIHYLESGRKIFSEQITKEEAEDLMVYGEKIEEGIGVRNNVLFKTEKGRILVEFFDDYVVFNSLDEYKDMQSFSEKLRSANRENESWMSGRNYLGENFPNQIEELINSLPDKMFAPESIFNLKESSLEKIDYYFYRNVINNRFVDQIYLPLLAYIGEMHRKKFKSQWKMKFNETWNCWNPFLIDENGTEYWLCRPLCKILRTDDSMWAPLRTAYLMNPNRLY